MNAIAVTNEATTYTQYQRIPATTLDDDEDRRGGRDDQEIDGQGTDGRVREPRGEERVSTGFHDAANVEPRGPDQADSRDNEVNQKTPGGRAGGVEPPSADAFMSRGV